MAAQSEPLAFPSRGPNREASRRFPGQTNGRHGTTAGEALAPPLNVDDEGRLLATPADLARQRFFDPTPPATPVATYDLGELFADPPPDPFHGCHELIANNHGLMAA